MICSKNRTKIFPRMWTKEGRNTKEKMRERIKIRERFDQWVLDQLVFDQWERQSGHENQDGSEKLI